MRVDGKITLVVHGVWDTPNNAWSMQQILDEVVLHILEHPNVTEVNPLFDGKTEFKVS